MIDATRENGNHSAQNVDGFGDGDGGDGCGDGASRPQVSFYFKRAQSLMPPEATNE